MPSYGAIAQGAFRIQDAFPLALGSGVVLVLGLFAFDSLRGLHLPLIGLALLAVEVIASALINGWTREARVALSMVFIAGDAFVGSRTGDANTKGVFDDG